MPKVCTINWMIDLREDKIHVWCSGERYSQGQECICSDAVSLPFPMDTNQAVFVRQRSFDLLVLRGLSLIHI